METGYLAVAPEALSDALAMLPGHVAVTGSRECSGVVMLAITGPYITEGMRYVVKFSDRPNERKAELCEVP